MRHYFNQMHLLIPEELIVSVALLMIVAGGFAVMIGALRAGRSLLLGGLALPVFYLVATAIKGALLTSLPSMAVKPLSFILFLLCVLAAIWKALGWLLGKDALSQALGSLLADAIKCLFRAMRRRTGILLMLLLMLYLMWDLAPVFES